MTGLAPDFPVEQTHIQDYYPPELRSFVTDVIVKSMIERGQWSGETRLRNFRTGEPIPVSDTHFMIRDASGKRILGMGTVTRDISEARRIADERERLLAQEKLARATGGSRQRATAGVGGALPAHDRQRADRHGAGRRSTAASFA